MKEMLGYQMDEVAASWKMSLSFDPTTLIDIAVYIHGQSVILVTQIVPLPLTVILLSS